MSDILTIIDFVPARSIDSTIDSLSSTHVTHPLSKVRSTPTAAHLASNRPPQESFDIEDGTFKQGRIIVIIAVLTGSSFISSLTNGYITIGLPRIASDLALPGHLLLWPSAVYS